jgi:hypothetical protein
MQHPHEGDFRSVKEIGKWLLSNQSRSIPNRVSEQATRKLALADQRLGQEFGRNAPENQEIWTGETSHRRAKWRACRPYSQKRDAVCKDRTGWLGFIDTFRTFCVEPTPEFRSICERLRLAKLEIR